MLKNLRHERFAQEFVRCGNASEAYRQAGYKGTRDANVFGSRLMANDSIQARVAEIRAENERKSEVGREEALKFCADVIRAKPSDAGPDNPLCELKMSKAGPYYAFPDKLGALARLASLCGWDKGTQAEQSLADSLSARLVTIRKRAR